MEPTSLWGTEPNGPNRHHWKQLDIAAIRDTSIATLRVRSPTDSIPRSVRELPERRRVRRRWGKPAGSRQSIGSLARKRNLPRPHQPSWRRWACPPRAAAGRSTAKPDVIRHSRDPRRGMNQSGTRHSSTVPDGSRPRAQKCPIRSAARDDMFRSPCPAGASGGIPTPSSDTDSDIQPSSMATTTSTELALA